MFVKDLLKGRAAVVTGAGTGIGKVIAEELAAHGCKVALVGRQASRLEAAAQELGAKGLSAMACPADVSEPGQVKDLFARVESQWGGVDILVNGAAANFIRPSEALTSVRWRKVIDIVLNGTFNCSMEAGKRMLKQGSGSIINLVASYAWLGAPGLAPSASAKAGVVALTRSLGVEWAARGVRVNAVCPGYIDTPQSRERLWPQEWVRKKLLDKIPAHRFGREKDVSDLVLFLVSPMAGYIQGEVIVVDGGESLGRGAMAFAEDLKSLRRPGAAE
ncbi:MAG: SDR family oxidoreductase [Elusimicrobia bacterium]|nr:SDR family oxidoreductase [Elusimicrobiota bacterium]